MYEETQMEKTFRKLKRLEEMLHDRMFIPGGSGGNERLDNEEAGARGAGSRAVWSV